jgi:lipoprotein LprG
MTRRTSASLGVVLALLLPLSALSACGGSDSPPKTESVHDVLAKAKKQFDDARSVHLTLSTDATPKSGDAVLGAQGSLTHQPAFEGQVTVVLGGFNADVPVVAVDGKVYAKLPLTPKYVPIDPAEYGAPNPADFADPDKGISGLLLELDGAKKTDRKREGSQLLTIYSGTLDGSLVDPIIPSADTASTYKTSVGIDDKGRIATLHVTGDFFSHDGPVTYDLALDDYGKSVTITAP